MGKVFFSRFSLKFIIIYPKRCNWFLHSHQIVEGINFSHCYMLKMLYGSKHTANEIERTRRTKQEWEKKHRLPCELFSLWVKEGENEKKTSPIKFNKCNIGMIDHSINLYFQINLFHNVSASMSFHFRCFLPLFVQCCFVYIRLFVLYESISTQKKGKKKNMAAKKKEIIGKVFFSSFALRFLIKAISVNNKFLIKATMLEGIGLDSAENDDLGCGSN